MEFNAENMRKKAEKGKIIITHMPLQKDTKEIWKMCQNDKLLINAIKKESENKNNEGIETFEQRENIIVTEEGFYFAFWENDLKNN